MPRMSKAKTTAPKGRLKKTVPAQPARRRPIPRAAGKPVYITEDEADVLVSKRRERAEKLIPWEQVEAELAKLD